MIAPIRKSPHGNVAKTPRNNVIKLVSLCIGW